MLWAFAGLLLRSALILSAAHLLLKLQRYSTAAYRHRLLSASFLLLLCWPLLSAILPVIDIPLPFSQPIRASVTIQQRLVSVGDPTAALATIAWPFIIWSAGVLVSLIPIVRSYVNVRRFVRQAEIFSDPGWQSSLEQARSRLQLNARPSLLIHPYSMVPFTFGFWRPGILLPADAVSWTPLRRRTVLLHELAHISRRDLVWQLLASLTAALWWFQPLAWVTRSCLRRESEHACDALVLKSGIRASDYAGELLEIAQRFANGAAGLPPPSP